MFGKFYKTYNLYNHNSSKVSTKVVMRTWRHYLLGSHFIVKTDNVATSYFQTQKKISPKQARWQDFLAEFDYTLEYKPGIANHVADALSRKAELAAMTSQPEGEMVDLIKEVHLSISRIYNYIINIRGHRATQHHLNTSLY